MKGESGISLCDTCSNCECIFQTGVVREQCEFYIEKNEYCRAIDDVLEIIDKRIEYNKPVTTLLQARAVSELNQIKHKIVHLKGDKIE